MFHEKSVLRASNLRHHPPGVVQQPARYRITDQVEFEIDLHEFREGSWQPYRWVAFLFECLANLVVLLSMWPSEHR